VAAVFFTAFLVVFDAAIRAAPLARRGSRGKSGPRPCAREGVAQQVMGEVNAVAELDGAARAIPSGLAGSSTH
jgi:hypothetical protein